MRRERAQRREQAGQVRMAASDAGQSGKKVIEAENVTFGYDGEPIVRDFSTTVFRGDRIGLIGPNGSGKSTLLKLLLGKLEPDAGEIKQGTRLEIVYFDQHRSVLRDDWTAAENVGEGRDFVTIDGKQKHVIGYLADFLFTPDRARAPITKFSGGERNRLLLAKLFASPSNLLVMDEPTNDLDAETLELLESLLADYPGTLLLVSHDRDFLDNVITASFVMEGDGRVGEYVGGYSDWKRQARAAAAQRTTGEPAQSSSRNSTTQPISKRAEKPKKLSYKLARELEQLPARVEKLEARMAELSARLNDPEFYRQPPGRSNGSTPRSRRPRPRSTPPTRAGMNWSASATPLTNTISSIASFSLSLGDCDDNRHDKRARRRREVCSRAYIERRACHDNRRPHAPRGKLNVAILPIVLVTVPKTGVPSSGAHAEQQGDAGTVEEQ